MVRLLPFKMVRRQRTVIVLVVLFILGNLALYSRFKSLRSQGDISTDIKGKYPPTEPMKNEDVVVESPTVEGIAKTGTKAPVRIDANMIETPAHTPGVPLLREKTSPNSFKVAVLVIACNRPSVGRCLDRLIKYKPPNVDVPIVVSQDCGDSATESVIRAYGDKVKLIKQPDLGNVENVPLNMQRFMGYYKISRHFKFALSTAFSSMPDIDSVIIVEDDIDIASDFYEYFLATRPLMEMDKSIWCVSAWNDNGKSGFVQGNDLLYRSDFFPGLGWMITRSIWKELETKWPLGFWDDWMRHPDQRKGRACIRPEISRTKTFGRIGVSLGQFFDQHLKYNIMNEEHYLFRSKDLTYLLKENYDKQFLDAVNKSPLVTADDLRIGNVKSDTVRIVYNSNHDFERLARMYGLMTDFKAGVPRGAYLGIVTFLKNGVRVFLTPSNDWQAYHE